MGDGTSEYRGKSSISTEDIVWYPRETHADPFTHLQCMLKCGADPCWYEAPQQNYHLESSDHQTRISEGPSEAAPQKQDEALPLLINGASKKSTELSRGGETNPRYSVHKRCNCLTHQKRASRLEASLEAASKAS